MNESAATHSGCWGASAAVGSSPAEREREREREREYGHFGSRPFWLKPFGSSHSHSSQPDNLCSMANNFLPQWIHESQPGGATPQEIAASQPDDELVPDGQDYEPFANFGNNTGPEAAVNGIAETIQVPEDSGDDEDMLGARPNPVSPTEPFPAAGGDDDELQGASIESIPADPRTPSPRSKRGVQGAGVSPPKFRAQMDDQAQNIMDKGKRIDDFMLHTVSSISQMEHRFDSFQTGVQNTIEQTLVSALRGQLTPLSARRDQIDLTMGSNYVNQRDAIAQLNSKQEELTNRLNEMEKAQRQTWSRRPEAPPPPQQPVQPLQPQKQQERPPQQPQAFFPLGQAQQQQQQQPPFPQMPRNGAAERVAKIGRSASPQRSFSAAGMG